MGDPLIGVAPDRRMRGVSTSLDPKDLARRGIRALVVTQLSEALSRRWESDAHLTLYTLPNEKTWPRLRKVSLPVLRAAGAEPRIPIVGIDVDNPGHSVWTPALAEGFVEAVVSAIGHASWLGDWRYFYVTRHGARFIYVLDEPQTPEKAEAVILGVLTTWAKHGVAADPECADWTRLFRLPHVMRGGTPTWEDTLPFDLETQEGKTLETALVPRIPRKAIQALRLPAKELVDKDKPSPQTVRSLLYKISKQTGRELNSLFFKRAEKWLRGRDCYECIFEGATLAQPGFRNSRIQTLVGGAIGVLYGRQKGITPEHIYALFFESASALEPDEDTDDWTDVLWEAVCKYWEQEAPKVQAKAVEQDRAAAEVVSIQTRMIRGAREWAPHIPALQGDDRTAFDWVLRRLIVTTPAGTCHLMKSDGYYDRLAVKTAQLHARIRQLGLDTVYPVTVPGQRGPRKASPADMIDANGCCVGQIEGIAGGKGSYMERVETDMPTLKLRLYGRRTDLVPSFDKQVDEWLRLFFGEAHQEKARIWIGHALAFEEGPVCALSYKGFPGAGKKMLVQGFAECLDTGIVADAKEFGNFQHFLMRTPFLCINEGWPPETGNRTQTRADVFRHYISGDPIVCEEKYQPRVVLRTPLRVIMTANNLDVVRAIFSARDMSPEDRAALAVRIFHIDADKAAPQYLRFNGGLRHTRGWIASDAHGSDGDARIARHFLWLHENRPAVAQGNRLLVEGRMPHHLLRAMATGSGRSPMVVETLLYMIDARKFSGAVLTKRGRVAVTPQAVVEVWRKQFATHSKRPLTVKSVSVTLESLSTEVTTKTINTPNGPQKARWRFINLPLLLEEATEMGYPCDKLLDIITQYEVWKEYAEQAKSGKVIRVKGLFKKGAGA